MSDVPDFPVGEEGISYVKETRQLQPVQPETCAACRGSVPATCCVRLYVPASALSINAGADDVSMLMCGVFFCDRHYWLLLNHELKFTGEAAAKFLTPEVKAAVELEFRKRNAYPNFDRATAGRIPMTDEDFRRAQQAVQAARKPQ